MENNTLAQSLLTLKQFCDDHECMDCRLSLSSGECSLRRLPLSEVLINYFRLGKSPAVVWLRFASCEAYKQQADELDSILGCDTSGGMEVRIYCADKNSYAVLTRRATDEDVEKLISKYGQKNVVVALEPQKGT